MAPTLIAAAILLAPAAVLAQPPYDGGGSWPTQGHDNSNSGTSQSLFNFTAEFGSLLWSTQTSDMPMKSSIAIDAEGGVYASTADGKVVKVSSAGEEVWESVAYGIIPGGPTVMGKSGDGTDSGGWEESDAVYIGNELGELHVLEASDGIPRFVLQASDEAITTPILVRNHAS